MALKLNYTHDTVETDKENMLNLEILNAKQIHLTDEDTKSILRRAKSLTAFSEVVYQKLIRPLSLRHIFFVYRHV